MNTNGSQIYVVQKLSFSDKEIEYLKHYHFF